MAIQEIRVGLQAETDPRGVRLLQQLTAEGLPIQDVRTATVYRFEGITEGEAEQLAEGALTDPVTQRFTLNKPLFPADAHSLEIGYKPGVMNPVSGSLMHVAANLGIHPTAVTSSTEYGFFGDVSNELLQAVGAGLTS